MTQYFEKYEKCPVCKSKIKDYMCFIHYWHAALLDGHRIENPYPTMCPSCGYVSHDFSAKTKVKIKDLQEDSYKTCDGLIEKLNFDENDIAAYRNYILARMNNNYKEMYDSLRQCMHLYGKELRAELLPEVYALFCKVYEDEIDKKDKEIIAVQLFYLRLLGRFQEAKGILDSIEYENFVDLENERLLFEAEMIEEHNSEVQDDDDYYNWLIQYYIKIYGAEFNRRFRAVVGEDVPLMYYDKIEGAPWIYVALHYAKSIAIKGSVLLSQQYDQLYDMEIDDLDERTRNIFSSIRDYYAKKLRKRKYCSILY